jgi:hypothetical protein
VARTAIFISDANNYGQGSPVGRSVKQLLRALRLWKAVNFVKTGGKGYTISEGDGLAYSYSVFDDFARVEAQCKSMHVINISGCGINPYRSAPHVALLAIKK